MALVTGPLKIVVPSQPETFSEKMICGIVRENTSDEPSIFSSVLGPIR